jgi:protoporphyrinogen/coproporphyrinogen III oxidase
MKRVVIIGGGLSGLAVAFRLRQRYPSWAIQVLEADSRLGGKIGTEQHNGFVVERGPNGIFDAKPHLLQLCRDVGLGGELIAASEGSRKNRFVYLNDKLQQLPGSISSLLGTRLLTLGGKLRLLSEPFRRQQKNADFDESIAAFARRRFGREAADVFIDALVTGIHAGDPEQLSVRCALPRLPMFEEKFGSVVRGVMASGKQRRKEMVARGEQPGPQRMWSFRGGLQTLVDRLADVLRQCLVTNAAVTSVRKQDDEWLVLGEGGSTWAADHVIITSPAPRQAECLAELDKTLACEIAAIRYNSVPVVALGYRKADAPIQPDGFGYIAPQRTRRPVLGVQWCSAIYPQRAPEGCVLWRALCGGTSRPDVAALPDDELIRSTHEEFKQTMCVTGEPVFTRIVRWPEAIPQYTVGHLARREKILQLAEKHSGLHLAGTAYMGVAMNDCAEQAELIASRLS